MEVYLDLPVSKPAKATSVTIQPVESNLLQEYKQSKLCQQLQQRHQHDVSRLNRIQRYFVAKHQQQQSVTVSSQHSRSITPYKAAQPWPAKQYSNLIRTKRGSLKPYSSQLPVCPSDDFRPSQDLYSQCDRLFPNVLKVRHKSVARVLYNFDPYIIK